MTDSELLKQVKALQDGLLRFATGGGSDGLDYDELRKLLITHPRLKSRAPQFLKVNRNLSQFWEYIKGEFAHYRERRKFIWDEFTPLIDELESPNMAPVDAHVSEALSSFNFENVHAVWQKALDRRIQDPEGAITAARTLLETVCKHILDELVITYEHDADLPKLYKTVANSLNLAPSQHSEAIFKQILGGCASVVEGLGALRNRLSDAHGKGATQAKPNARHALLAVNLAGSMATFLVETWESRKK